MIEIIAFIAAVVSATVAVIQVLRQLKNEDQAWSTQGVKKYFPPPLVIICILIGWALLYAYYVLFKHDIYLQYRDLVIVRAQRARAPEIFLTVMVVVFGLFALQWNQAWNVRNDRPRFAKRAGLATILTTILIGLLSAHFAIDRKDFPSDKFGIAVATFGEGPDYEITDESIELSDEIAVDIEDAVEVTADLTERIAFRRVGVLQSGEQARAKGERIGAELVLRGRIVRRDGDIIVYYSVMETSDLLTASLFPRIVPNQFHLASVNFPEDTKNIQIDLTTTEINAGLAEIGKGLYYYLAEANSSKALTHFELAFRALADPDDEDENSLALEKVGDNNLALIYYYLGKSHQLLGNYRASAEMLEKAAELDGSDTAIHLAQIYNYRAMDREYDQQGAFERVIELTEQQGAVDASARLRAKVNRAFAYEGMLRYDEAIEEWEEIIEENEAYFSAYLSLANLYRTQNRTEEAHEKLDKAAAIAAGKPRYQAWLNLYRAAVYTSEGKYSSALEAQNEAIELAPDLSQAYLSRAQVYRHLGIHDRAIADYQTAIDLGENPAVMIELAQYYLDEELQLAEQAIDYFEAALDAHELYPEGVVRAQLGQAYARAGNIDRAIETFEAALSEPGNTESFIRGLYGATLVEIGENDAAIAQLEQAQVLMENGIHEPADITTIQNLAHSYEIVGDYKNAIDLYESLIAPDADVSESLMEFARTRLEALTGDDGQAPDDEGEK